MPPPSSVPGTQVPIDTQVRYAWDWFSYHAGQRFVAFRMFLIVIGLVVVGYLKCLELGWNGLGMTMAILGALMSFAFLCMEIRNEELVNCGRRALDKLESRMNLVDIRQPDEDREQLCGLLKKAKWLTKHSVWLKVILIASIVLFAYALHYAATLNSTSPTTLGEGSML